MATYLFAENRLDGLYNLPLRQSSGSDEMESRPKNMDFYSYTLELGYSYKSGAISYTRTGSAPFTCPIHLKTHWTSSAPLRAVATTRIRNSGKKQMTSYPCILIHQKIAGCLCGWKNRHASPVCKTEPLPSFPSKLGCYEYDIFVMTQHRWLLDLKLPLIMLSLR